jgi:hypothetical protein
MKTTAFICAMATLVISSVPAEAARKKSACPRVESKGDVAWTLSGAKAKADEAWRGDVIAQFGGEAAENMARREYKCSTAGAKLRFRKTCRVIAYACKN